jgi:dynein light intermediate chain
VNINQCLKCNDVLDRILPEKKWEKDGKLYCQKLSNQPGSKSDIKDLKIKLDMYLNQFNAREVGICLIKEELYFQCFSKFENIINVFIYYFIFLFINLYL